MKDAKNAPVENIAKAIEMFATLMAAKKVIQCKAIMIPAIENLAITLSGTLRDIFLSLININISNPAMVILYQTKGVASSEINSPRIAVNPAISTNKCRCK